MGGGDFCCLWVFSVVVMQRSYLDLVCSIQMWGYSGVWKVSFSCLVFGSSFVYRVQLQLGGIFGQGGQVFVGLERDLVFEDEIFNLVWMLGVSQLLVLLLDLGDIIVYSSSVQVEFKVVEQLVIIICYVLFLVVLFCGMREMREVGVGGCCYVLFVIGILVFFKLVVLVSEFGLQVQYGVKIYCRLFGGFFGYFYCCVYFWGFVGLVLEFGFRIKDVWIMILVNDLVFVEVFLLLVQDVGVQVVLVVVCKVVVISLFLEVFVVLYVFLEVILGFSLEEVLFFVWDV